MACPIQQVLEQAAAHLNNGQPVASIVAGRTDAGVHAEGQVAHIDLPNLYSARTVRDALNYHMKPHPVVVLNAVTVADDWNARFSANPARLSLSDSQPPESTRSAG